jgi:hypothetical protein
MVLHMRKSQLSYLSQEEVCVRCEPIDYPKATQYVRTRMTDTLSPVLLSDFEFRILIFCSV